MIHRPLRPRLRQLAAALALAAAVALPGGHPALAVGDIAPGAVGVDISFPQCGREVSLGPDQFAVVGINGGRPFTMNRCLGSQYEWAKGGGALPSLYVNLEYGEHSAGYQVCPESDHACAAYNFGYNAAEYAFNSAYYATGGQSLAASIWWLDVETENAWSGHSDRNGEVVRGAVDYLRHNTARTVGIYSVPRQWHWIVGGSYTPPAEVGGWIAGAEDLQDVGQCSRRLWPGGATWMFQYLNLDLDLDQNRAC